MVTSRDLRLWLLWLPPALMTGYLKLVVLLQSGVCYHCAALDGQRWVDKLAELSFFRSDLLLAGIAVPALLSLLSRRFPGRLLPVAVAAVSAALYLYLFAQAQCVLTVGGFVTPALLLEGLEWAMNAPEAGSAYLPGGEMFFVAGGLAVIAAALRWNLLARRSEARGQESPAAPARALAAAVGIVTLAAWLWPVPATALHGSALLGALRPSSSWRPAGEAGLEGLPPRSLVEEYRRLCRAPRTRRDPRYWAAMAGADVLFFVFETGPARCLPIDGDLDDFPTLARLRRRAFTAPQHYTTAPVTTLAVLSIFNSLYPSGSGVWKRAGPGHAPLPGLPRSLAEAGYAADYYVDFAPADFPAYAEQLRVQGFQEIHGPRGPAGRLDGRGKGERRRQSAEAAVELLRRELRERIRANERYLAVFFPQFGHAPWLDIFGGKYPDLYRLGRAYMALQDRWLGEVVADLEQAGRLEHTIIVVTADHGIRTRKEDPGFPVGAADAVSFQVPLLIWAPGAVASTVTIPYPTSHLDIAPTVLDLLGVDRGRQFEQGAPLWDEGLADRITFYLGKFVTGSDGIYDRGTFYMYHYLTGALRESVAMHFDLTRPPAPDSPRRTELLRRLARFAALQRALMNGLGEGRGRVGTPRTPRVRRARTKTRSGTGGRAAQAGSGASPSRESTRSTGWVARGAGSLASPACRCRGRAA